MSREVHVRNREGVGVKLPALLDSAILGVRRFVEQLLFKRNLCYDGSQRQRGTSAGSTRKRSLQKYFNSSGQV
jgi:hypothetical protein